MVDRDHEHEEASHAGITPNLWFDTEAEEAAQFYVSVFPNSEITAVTHYGEAGPRAAGMVLTVEFTLDGQEYTAINGGPEFTFDEAVSFLVNCADQAEVEGCADSNLGLDPNDAEALAWRDRNWVEAELEAASVSAWTDTAAVWARAARSRPGARCRRARWWRRRSLSHRR